MNEDFETIKKYRDKAAQFVISGFVLDYLNVIEAAAEHMANEISRLKAELEKMKKCDACDDCWRSKGNPPYCSRGQRRESEEGK